MKQGIRVISGDNNAIAEVFRFSLKHRCPIHIVRHPDVFIVPKIILEELENNGTKYEWVDLTEEEKKTTHILAEASRV